MTSAGPPRPLPACAYVFGKHFQASLLFIYLFSTQTCSEYRNNFLSHKKNCILSLASVFATLTLLSKTITQKALLSTKNKIIPFNFVFQTYV